MKFKSLAHSDSRGRISDLGCKGASRALYSYLTFGVTFEEFRRINAVSTQVGVSKSKSKLQGVRKCHSLENSKQLDARWTGGMPNSPQFSETTYSSVHSDTVVRACHSELSHQAQIKAAAIEEQKQSKRSTNIPQCHHQALSHVELSRYGALCRKSMS